MSRIKIIKLLEDSHPGVVVRVLDVVRELEKENEKLESEVKRLSELACKMCNGHGYVGNVMEDGDCPDCDGSGIAIK